MRLRTTEDIALPQDRVFAYVTDFDLLERRALRRGAEVRRLDQGPVGKDTRWTLAFDYRGKHRKVDSQVTDFTPPDGYTVESHSSGVDIVTRVELAPAGADRTRLKLVLDITPKTLPARVLVQSLRLGRGAVEARMSRRLADYAREIEARHAA
ncbi:SRPBCC family protein [Aestuariibius sp. 2305UL40-4]|uniref:SRPBCC family protein n=1 Tax=Aestuariibius violaceus TaxID=3234132 RepID=UPI00345ECBC2